MTPRHSIEAACRDWGADEVRRGCRALLAGAAVDSELVQALGGPGWVNAVRGGPNEYWLRVWGARGLLWNWGPEAVPELVAATGDDAWRVREMAAKVVARHRVGEAFAAVERLRTDPVARVRAAAARALATLTAAGA